MLYVGLISDESGAEVTKKKKKNYRLQVQKNHLLAGDHCKKKKKKYTTHKKRFQARNRNSYKVYFYTCDK